MTASVTHTFVSAIPTDSAATAAGLVTPADWNANHTITGLAPTASPTFTGTVTMPDNSTWSSSELLMNGSSEIAWPSGAAWTLSGISGVAVSMSTYNGLAITTNGSNTLNIAAGKTLHTSNSVNFLGTDNANVNFGTGGTILYGNQNITLSGAVTGNGTTSISTSLASGLTINSPTINTPTVSSPTYSGTMTFPDASTWTSSGLSSLNGLYLSSPVNDTNGYSIAIGRYAMQSLPASAAYYNIAIGAGAMDGALTTAALYNVAIGFAAMAGLTSGTLNMALGFESMAGITSGYNNVGVGTYSLDNVAGGYQNVAIGYQTLFNTTGYNNIAVGADSGYDVTTGYQNIFIGFDTGRGITTGNGNTVIGTTITGLSAGLTDALILASGVGVVLDYNYSSAGSVFTNFPLVLNQPSASGGASALTINNQNTSANAVLIFEQGSSQKFQFGVDGSANFFVYDNTGGQNCIYAANNGNITLSPKGGTTAVTGALTVSSTIKFGASGTGTTTALLGTTNCPATTGTAPYVWLKNIAPDGSTVYTPAWK